MDEQQYLKKIEEQRELTEAEQAKAGKPVAGDIGDEEKNFAKTLIDLIDKGDIDPYTPNSFLRHEIYDKLDQEWKDKTDLALINISNQVRLIYDFYKDPSFTNDSPQLQTMITQLWHMKQEIETTHDVFKF